MKSFSLSTLCRAAVLTAAVAFSSIGAHAAGTMSTTGWLFSGNTVNSTTGLVSPATYNGLAGGFKAKMSGTGNAIFDINPLELYCVDLGQFINVPGGPYSVKIDGEIGNTDFTIMTVGNVFSAAVATRLTQLVGYAKSSAGLVDNAAESTSLQLAIWNTVYDTGVGQTSPNFLGTGTYKDTSSYAGYANTLLTNSASFSSSMQLYVLKSAGMQDQLFWVDSGRTVPEPASLALVGMALLGLGLSRRRAKA